jgi:hypothetical protein
VVCLSAVLWNYRCIVHFLHCVQTENRCSFLSMGPRTPWRTLEFGIIALSCGFSRRRCIARLAGDCCPPQDWHRTRTNSQTQGARCRIALMIVSALLQERAVSFSRRPYVSSLGFFVPYFERAVTRFPTPPCTIPVSNLFRMSTYVQRNGTSLRVRSKLTKSKAPLTK